jgi:anti-sigma regulatory factor (Ser/Thr protein kinase)
MVLSRPHAQSTSITCTPHAPAAARRWVREQLAGAPAADVMGDVELVVSELITNAVLHGHCDSSTIGVAVQPGVVRVSVADPAPVDGVTVLPHRPERVGGLGLRLVEAVAQNWGVETTAQGKVVWAELPWVPGRRIDREVDGRDLDGRDLDGKD